MSGGSILLVRHGETEWNRERRYQGWSDSPLTACGLAQAEAIGRHLCTHPDAAGATKAVPVATKMPIGNLFKSMLLRVAASRHYNSINVARAYSAKNWE